MLLFQFQHNVLCTSWLQEKVFGKKVKFHQNPFVWNPTQSLCHELIMKDKVFGKRSSLNKYLCYNFNIVIRSQDGHNR